MTVILDTGFLLALHNEHDPHYPRACEIAREIMEGAHGQPVVSDYVVAEALNYVTGRSWPAGRSRVLLADLLGRGEEPWMGLVKVDSEVFEAAVRLFEAVGVEKGLSFTDCSSIVLAKSLKAELIASFDSDFDGVLPRLS